MRQRLAICALAGFVAGACGGGGTTEPNPVPTPVVPTHSLTATVFYDENANGVLDSAEAVRVPGVQVVIGTGSGTSAPGTGKAQVTGIREGTHSVGVRIESVPTFFQPQAVAAVQVPGTAEVNIPMTLPIGNNQANVYYGYGDSITAGEGSVDGGYGIRLQNLLGPHFGRAEVKWFGRTGRDSAEGLERAANWIGQARAAYVLILYGTNDWQNQVCQSRGPEACFTIDSLRGMVEIARDRDTLPVLGTLPPVNPARAPEGRNLWIDQMNTRIKALGQEQQALVADINAEFRAAGSLPALFWDDVHPNDAGYQVLAQAWFKAISRSRSATASSGARRFGFSR